MFRYGLALAGAGTVIGLAAAAGLTRLMKSVLFGISPIDPLTYTAVPLVLIAATVLASYLPARRAAAVDPVETPGWPTVTLDAEVNVTLPALPALPLAASPQCF